jgi:hypothetical protein
MSLYSTSYFSKFAVDCQGAKTRFSASRLRHSRYQSTFRVSVRTRELEDRTGSSACKHEHECGWKVMSDRSSCCRLIRLFHAINDLLCFDHLATS